MRVCACALACLVCAVHTRSVCGRYAHNGDLTGGNFVAGMAANASLTRSGNDAVETVSWKEQRFFSPFATLLLRAHPAAAFHSSAPLHGLAVKRGPLAGRLSSQAQLHLGGDSGRVIDSVALDCFRPGGKCSQLLFSRHPRISMSAAAGTLENADSEKERDPPQFPVGKVVVATAAILGLTAWLVNIGQVLGKVARSGFAETFSLMFASDVGDKHFFIAALMAARFGRWVSFAGTNLALTAMTLLSLALGQIFRAIPPALTNGIPFDDYFAITAFSYFGLSTLRDAAQMPDDSSEVVNEERKEAEEAVAEVTIKKNSVFRAIVSTFNLVFVSELGDRSFVSTIALVLQKNPLAVTLGATLAHAFSTAVAVIGGGVLSKYLSEKKIGYLGGAIFLGLAISELLEKLPFFGR